MSRLDGFDGAHYQTVQAEPDLAATLLAGLWWIAWKVSQSDQYLDPTFPRIRSQWGGFRMRGMYHWLSSTKNVNAQAANFMRGVGVVQHGEFVMLDAEEKNITVAMCLLWCQLIEAITHRPVVIYTGLYVAGGTIWNSPELRMSKYGPRPFIVAAYVSDANLRARMAALNALPFDAWQFSSNGPVPGIVGRCDMDQIDNVAAFELACEISHIPIPQPSTEDSDMDVVTNAEDFDAANPALTVKFAVAYRGQSLYHLSGPEWAAGGSKPGVPMSNADLDGLAAIPMPTVTIDLDALATKVAAKIPPIVDPATVARLAKIEAVAIQLNDSVARARQREADAGKAMTDAGAALLG